MLGHCVNIYLISNNDNVTVVKNMISKGKPLDMIPNAGAHKFIVRYQNNWQQVGACIWIAAGQEVQCSVKCLNNLALGTTFAPSQTDSSCNDIIISIKVPYYHFS